MSSQDLGPFDRIVFRDRKIVTIKVGKALPHSADLWWERGWSKSLDFLEQARFQLSAAIPRANSFRPEALSPEASLNMANNLLGRRSMRAFPGLPMSKVELEACLAAVYAGAPFSDGTLGVEVLRAICVVFNIDGLEPGIYEFVPSKGALVLRRPGEFRSEICSCIAGMATSMTANFGVFICADFERLMLETGWGNLALRKLYYYVGFVGQRLLSKANLTNISGVPTPALSDSQIAKLFDLDQSMVLPIYSVVMGRVSE